MQTHLTHTEFVVALIVACYGGWIGTAIVIAYVFARE